MNLALSLPQGYIFNDLLKIKLLTQGQIKGMMQITSTAVFGGLIAFNDKFCAITRHTVRFFMVKRGRGLEKDASFAQVFAGLSTRNRLTTSLIALGQVSKWKLVMTESLPAQSRILSLHSLTTQFDNEPRIIDLELATALQFERPRKIRELIENNKEELEAFGLIALRRGDYKGKQFNEYFLNESQALLLAILSRTPQAKVVRKTLIDVFQAYRKNQTIQASPKTKTKRGLIAHRLHGGVVMQRRDDGFVNGTQLCALFGKEPQDFLKSATGKFRVAELNMVFEANPQSLVVARLHVGEKENGTWLHPALALHLATWLRPWVGDLVQQWNEAFDALPQLNGGKQ